MRGFRDLKVWEKAHALAIDVYRTTGDFPREELFGLTSQLRRAALSVPSNIAEGVGRTGNAELARFCRIAHGSASELEYQLLLARDLGLLADSAYESLAERAVEVMRMLSTLTETLTTHDSRLTPHDSRLTPHDSRLATP